MTINDSSLKIDSNIVKDTILIVDDNADMLFFLVDHFGDKYNVLSAEDGTSAWSMTEQYMPDLIISDLMMPGMDGIQFCHMVKTNYATLHIPFILLTAKDADDSRIVGFKTGADEYVSKPFNINMLEVRVENLFVNRERLRQAYQQRLLQDLDNDKHKIDPFINQIESFVKENIVEPNLNVEKLSVFMNMSRITLYRKIKMLTGLTAIELIRNIKLQQAAHLLKTHNLTVNEVCYSVGFSDVDYFRKVFKGMFGVVPSEYA